jgi:hypothetical protein
LTLFLPKLLPDETLYSLMVRVCRLNGFVDCRDLYEKQFNLGVCTSFVDFKVDWAEVFEAHLGRYAKSIHDWHSVNYPSPAERRTDPLRGQHSLAEASFAGGSNLLFCPKCRNEDSRQFGFSYWRVSHQLEFCDWCVNHEVRLQRLRIKKCSLHIYGYLPSDTTDFDRQEDTPVTPLALSMAFPEFRRKLLADQMEAGSSQSDNLCGMLLDGIYGIGCLKDDGKVAARMLLKFLCQRLMGCEPARLDKVNLRRIGRLVSALKSGQFTPVSEESVTLMAILYESTEALSNQSLWASVFGYRGVHQTTVNMSADTDVRVVHRKVCLDYLEQNEAPSRLGFTQRHYRSFCWLNRWDSDWLDLRLPMVGRQPKQLDLFDGL